MIKREIEGFLESVAQQFKAVVVTGPRQSGKTTLARNVFPEKEYVSLESPDERARAERDPRSFLARFPEGCILDEVQRVPHLFSYLQQILDESSGAGMFILTGSQQFGLLESVTQSLAGRVAILQLLPFGLSELKRGGSPIPDLDHVLFNGSYPPVFDQNLDVQVWYNSYISTYVERDVRQIVNVENLNLFQRFMEICAANLGQMLNTSRIGNDCGVNHSTIRAWLSVLEASYICFRLPPHFNNYRKRVVKSPKLYFYDVGLAIRLLGIESPAQLATHPLRGAIFENWVVVELMKGRLNQGKRENLFFWRNNTGLEVDILLDSGGQLLPIEIKSGATLATDWFMGLKKWLDLAGDDAVNPTLIYGGDSDWKEGRVDVIPWRCIDELAAEI